MTEPVPVVDEPSGDEPVVDVAIVSWNTGAAAARAAACFKASLGIQARITVIDNASAAEDRHELERSLPPGVDLMVNTRNVGYGSAANAALAKGVAPLICVSNSDVHFGPLQISNLATATLGHPQAGMVGPVFTGSTNAYHAHLPHPIQLLAGAFVGRLGRRRAAMPAPGKVAEIGQVSGACFLMRRNAWERLDGFDAGFFLWYDDVDLAKRLADAGYRNFVAGSALVSHGGAVSFAQIPHRKAQKIRLESLSRYLHKHHPRLRAPAAPLLALARALRAR